MPITVRDSGWTRPVIPDLRATVADVADDLARGIRRRTEAGRDADGHPFAAKRDGSPSNLIRTGRMVRSFEVRESDERRAVLAPGRRQSIKGYVAHHGRQNQPSRAWVALSPQQIADARDAIARAVER